MTDIDLVKLKELALSASSGCWHQETEHECAWNVVDENGIQVAIMQQRTTIRDNPKQTDRAANAAFIAGANPAVILTLIEQLEAARIQIDGANDRCRLIFYAKNHWADRARAAEAELKRRDEQEPAAFTSQANLDAISSKPAKQLEFLTGDKSVYRNPVALYTTAVPAVLPPEVTPADAECSYSAGRAEAWASGANWMREKVKAMSCQPEKVVKLPAAEKDGGTDWQGDITAGCVNRMRGKCIEGLEAAGVKWVEGE